MYKYEYLKCDKTIHIIIDELTQMTFQNDAISKDAIFNLEKKASISKTNSQPKETNKEKNKRRQKTEMKLVKCTDSIINIHIQFPEVNINLKRVNCNIKKNTKTKTDQIA